MACFPRFNAFLHRSAPSSVLRETNIAILASISSGAYCSADPSFVSHVMSWFYKAFFRPETSIRISIFHPAFTLKTNRFSITFIYGVCYPYSYLNLQPPFIKASLPCFFQ